MPKFSTKHYKCLALLLGRFIADNCDNLDKHILMDSFVVWFIKKLKEDNHRFNGGRFREAIYGDWGDED